MAARFLAERGARILARNRRVGKAEVDLLVAFGSEVVAVEVKTRRGTEEDPLWAADPVQLDRVRRAARTLSAGMNRVDLVAVRFDAHGVTVRWVPHAG